MQIRFKTNSLERQYTDYKEACKEHGDQIARKYIERINIIRAAKDINVLMRIRTLRCHPLRGDREGEWAIKLSGFYRLIFTLEGENLQIAKIEEVSKHYDD
jgi:proteic killer suppression protein